MTLSIPVTLPIAGPDRKPAPDLTVTAYPAGAYFAHAALGSGKTFVLAAMMPRVGLLSVRGGYETLAQAVKIGRKLTDTFPEFTPIAQSGKIRKGDRDLAGRVLEFLKNPPLDVPAGHISARGILRHHFWGDYRATITLHVERPEYLPAVLAALPAFKTDAAHPTSCGYHGGGEELKAQEDRLVDLGADRKAITSLAHSIDHGDPFVITVPMLEPAPVDETVTA